MSTLLLPADNRLVVVAVDHGLYSWPVAGLGRRGPLLRAVVAAGADAVIASYGTLRAFGAALSGVRRIMKLDLTTTALGAYPLTEYRVAWTVDDAAQIGADAVLTYVQLGVPGELEALAAAARVAVAAEAAGLPYVCEIMPIESERFPDPFAPAAVAAAARTGAEIGAHVVKTSMPSPPEAVAEAVEACDVPVVIAGGEVADDRAALVDAVSRAVASGAAGVAFGRNVWTAEDPAAVVAALVTAVHGAQA